MSRQRQEVLNVILAQLLLERGAIVAPETIEYTGADRKRQMPDVIVSYRGLRTAIEGEIDASNAREKAIASARGRVETGIAHIGIGVIYPEDLRQTEFHELKEILAEARLQIAVVTEAEETGFSTGTVDNLERILRSTFDQLVQEDVVAESVDLLDNVVDKFAAVTVTERGNWARITEVLNGEMTDKELSALNQKQRAANCRIGGLVLVNAMIFHDILSRHQHKVTPLRSIIANRTQENFADEWDYVLKKINYYAIFSLARDIFLGLSPATPGMEDMLWGMIRTAAQISERKAALRHDLMGRVYHRLLAEAKYLGTYYTSIPAATMLLKLSLQRDAYNVDWSNPDALKQFHVADLACGTGTLLMAAADAIIDNHVRDAASKNQAVQLEETHHHIAENILYGYDVLPSAIHLTASTLAMRTPDIPLKTMNLFSLPLGGTDDLLGSIELIRPTRQLPFEDLFRDKSERMTGEQAEEIETVPYPPLDLCVMNPPFVRSVGGNLLFGTMPDQQRPKMQKRLKDVIKDANAKANITAGLGSVFIAVGDRHVKPGGRLSLVLPKALLSGYSWGKSRELINSNYRLDYIIVSHDATRWNFSDSTDLSEVMVVATRRHPEDNITNHQVTVVNLWRNPTKALEALTLTEQIQKSDPPNLITEPGAARLTLYDEPAGEVVTFNWNELKDDWFFPTAFAQSDLTRLAYKLKQGKLQLPGDTKAYSLPLTKLENLGVLGPDRRDIYDGFNPTDAPTPYPAFWGHDADEVTTMEKTPNKYLSPLKKPKKGRKLRKVEDLWPKAGKVLIAERIRLNTYKTVAIYTNEKVLSNVWWSFTLNSEIVFSDAEKILTLWLNSSLALTVLVAMRDETEGSWISMKKPSLRSSPILDLTKLTARQITEFVSLYDKICLENLLPIPQMEIDKTRKMIDEQISKILNLPDISILRKMLAREPVVCANRIG